MSEQSPAEPMAVYPAPQAAQLALALLPAVGPAAVLEAAVALCRRVVPYIYLLYMRLVWATSRLEGSEDSS